MLYNSLNEEIIEYNDLIDLGIYPQIVDYLKSKGIIKGRKKKYYTDFFTMDIETTTVGRSTDEPIAFTYSIAVYICNKCILFRCWEDYTVFIMHIAELLGLHKYQRLVCFVHNLPYEFQFMRDFMHITDVFATDKRKVVKCYSIGIEYRCSYKLTNMSLAKFTSNIPNIKHGKLSGEDFDYNKLRTPSTPLLPHELDYIYNDVAGLYEALDYTLKHDIYNIANMPITSTGFVRNELRKEVQKNSDNRKQFLNTRLDQYTYGLLRLARRGGNTHCNPVYSCMELDDLLSMDMSSGYPAVMIQCKFPMTKFLPASRSTDFRNYIGKYACILDVTFYNIKVKNLSSVPYIAKAHCTQLLNIVGDNGRVLEAECLSMIITDIDYQIIADTYNFTKVECRSCLCSKYGYLPKELRRTLLKQYRDKTMLKDGDQYMYMKQKNKFNANFGCMLTDICQETVEYNEHSDKPFTKVRERDYQSQLDKYYNSPLSFLEYQHGVWVTAHCRNRLQKAIKLLGDDMVYCDTDSAKFFDTPKNRAVFDKLNDEIRQEIIDCGLNCSVEYKGKIYTLGLWENDGHYTKFKSMGAKKYCYYDDDGIFEITVAGLSKSKARDYLVTQGGIDAFKEGTIVPPDKSGRTSAHYNDYRTLKKITINGEEITIGSNLVITDATYQFGLTEEYQELLTDISEGVYY